MREGDGGLIERGLIKFVPLKRSVGGAGGGEGGLNRGFTICPF